MVKCQATVDRRQCGRWAKYEIDRLKLCHSHAAEYVFERAVANGDVRTIAARPMFTTANEQP